MLCCPIDWPGGGCRQLLRDVLKPSTVLPQNLLCPELTTLLLLWCCATVPKLLSLFWRGMATGDDYALCLLPFLLVNHLLCLCDHLDNTLILPDEPDGVQFPNVSVRSCSWTSVCRYNPRGHWKCPWLPTLCRRSIQLSHLPSLLHSVQGGRKRRITHKKNHCTLTCCLLAEVSWTNASARALKAFHFSTQPL